MYCSHIALLLALSVSAFPEAWAFQGGAGLAQHVSRSPHLSSSRIVILRCSASDSSTSRRGLLVRQQDFESLFARDEARQTMHEFSSRQAILIRMSGIGWCCGGCAVANLVRGRRR